MLRQAKKKEFMKKTDKCKKLCLEIADLDNLGRSYLLGMVEGLEFSTKKSPNSCISTQNKCPCTGKTQKEVPVIT
jgi:hypothetical protein